MTRAAWLTLGIAFFAIVGTANSGGYRYGVSDQAFYIPAVSLRADDALFPRDRGVFEPQMRLWLGDEVLGTIVRTTGIDLPTLFAAIQLLTLVVLAVGIIWLARSLGCDWWTIALCLLLFTLRHRIAKTGANSIEGYMHPRMLAFAIGLIALGYTTRLRHASAAFLTVVAAVIHTSTAIWFGGVVLVAALWSRRDDPRARLIVAGATIAAMLVLAAVVVTGRAPIMDDTWLSAIGDRDYLFSADWPIYAWIGNLAYPAVLLAIHRRRVSQNIAVPGEAGLVAGLLALVAVFLVTVPVTELRIAFFVQLQANRIFWLLDAAVAVFVAWWLMQDLARHWPEWRRAAIVGVMVLLAVGRGAYVLHETNRPLVQFAPATDDWMRVMKWLRTQPSSLHVLADPGHAWKYGTSVRVAALRDTPLESGKDPAMAMYDRDLAVRVTDRTAAFGDFDSWSIDDVRRVSARYDVDVFVDRADRHFDLPVLFRNPTFVVYDLR